MAAAGLMRRVQLGEVVQLGLLSQTPAVLLDGRQLLVPWSRDSFEHIAIVDGDLGRLLMLLMAEWTH